MATGLRECNGSMYHFLPSGAMATGWVLDGGTWYYAAGSGALARGPVSVGGVSYCFDAETGAMLTGYQADAQGVRLFFTTTKFRISRLISFGFHRFAKVPHPFFANCPIFPSSRLPRTFCSARRTQPADHDA